MNKTVLVNLILCFFLCLSLSLKAQDTGKKLPLFKVLKTLETLYNITFIYADLTIKGKTSKVPNANLSLSEAVDFLNKNTSLNFKVLSNYQVVIQANKQVNESFKLQKLNEVVVVNYLTKGITLNNYGSIQLNPNKFGILPGLIEPDILQTIQALPGITSIDETVSNLNVRGGTNDQNLILWDGIKMYQSGHFFGLISAFNPYIIKDVFVTKNGTSAAFGDGVSSTIDMRLDNELNDNFSSGFGFNLINADAFAKIPITENLELQVAARRSITDIIETPTYNQYFKRIFQDTDVTNNQTETNQTVTSNEEFYFYDLTTKLLYNISEKDKLRFSFINIYNNLDYLEEATVNNTFEALSSGITQRNLAGIVSYNRQWNSRFSSDLQVYASNYKLNATNFDIINDQRLIQENEVLDTALKLNTNYNLSNTLILTAGYQFKEIGIRNLQDVNNPVFRSSIKEVIRNHSAYSEVTYQSENTNTNLNLGVRGNYFQKFNELLIEPRLSFSQRFLDYFRVEVLGEFKSQTTSQIIDFQNDFLGIEKRRWVLADNTNIPITKSKQASVGFHFNKNKLLISAEAYLKEVDGITTRSQGFQNQYQFVNAIGSYNITGVDFLINKQFQDFSTWLSYSYSTNNYQFDTLNNGEEFPNNADINHALTFAGTYALKDLKFALGVNWHSGVPTTEPEPDNQIQSGNINYQKPNSNRLKDYLRTDFSTTYTFNLGDETKAKIGLSVWNVLNKKNILNSYYNLNDDAVSKIETQSLGITPNVSFRVDF